MLWIRLALRNTLRHPRRTMLTAGTVLAATALLTVLLAYLSGVLGGITRDFTAPQTAPDLQDWDDDLGRVIERLNDLSGVEEP